MPRTNVYYLIRDILKTFSAATDSSLAGVLSQYLVSKEAVVLILRDQVSSGKPEYLVLKGALIVQGEYLRKFPQGAYYEVMEVIEEIKYCYEKDKRKTIRNISRVVVLRLFSTLYFELVIMPTPHPEDLVYLKKFGEYFTKQEMFEIMQEDIFMTRFIFQRMRIDMGGSGDFVKSRAEILEKFYAK